MDLANRRTEKTRIEHIAATQGLPFQRGDVLFHSTHGLCRVKGIVGKPSGLEGLSYWLEPARSGKHLSRFFASVFQMSESGFHRLITEQEVDGIFASFRRGGSDLTPNLEEDFVTQLRTVAQGNTARSFAEVLLMVVSRRTDNSRGESKIVKHAAEALAQEIAVVLKIPVKQAFSLIRKHLRAHLAVHPWMNNVLICKD